MSSSVCRCGGSAVVLKGRCIRWTEGFTRRENGGRLGEDRRTRPGLVGNKRTNKRGRKTGAGGAARKQCRLRQNTGCSGEVKYRKNLE